MASSRLFTVVQYNIYCLGIGPNSNKNPLLSVAKKEVQSKIFFQFRNPGLSQIDSFGDVRICLSLYKFSMHQEYYYDFQ